MLLAGSLAGCGGSGGPSPYSLARTRSCFHGEGVPAVQVTNRALPGSQGNLLISLGARFGLAQVYLVFGRDAKEAAATENHAVDLAESTFKARSLYMSRSAVRAGVEVTRNVFVYSASGPIAENVRGAIHSCLR